jgi:hypothetical protein
LEDQITIIQVSHDLRNKPANPGRAAFSSQLTQGAEGRRNTKTKTSGSTGTRTQDQRIKKTSSIGDGQEPSGNPGGASDVLERPRTDSGQSAGNQALLEAALRVAIEERDTVAIAKVIDEMKAERERVAGVVSLDAERAKRGSKA